MDSLSLLVAACWFAGGFVSGLTGIGGAMVAVPVAAMFIPMHEVIPLSCLLNVVMDGCLAALYFRHCRLSALLPLLAGSVPGALAGLYILQAVSGAALQGAAGLLLIVYVFWQHIAKAGRKRPDSWLTGSAAGFGASVLGTAISFDGPPAGAYALYCGWDPHEVLGTLGVFFVLRGMLTCVLQAFAGFYTPEVIHYALVGAPSVSLGVLCAFPVVKHIRVSVFRKALMGVIGMAGLTCLWKAFTS